MTPKANALGALVLFSADIDRTVEFYRALGVEFDVEQHDEEGPVHHACDLGGTHFAIFPGTPGAAPPMRSSGSMFPGLVVESVVESLEEARKLGARVRQEPEVYPWGPRAVLEDPDGRPVEIFERSRL
jgi:lactoylglutathione lyase